MLEDAKQNAPFVRCGAGTVPDGSYCVLAPGSGGAPAANPDAGDASAPPPDDTPPVFGGAVHAETGSDESALVSWSLAVDDVTPRSRIVYEVAWGDHAGFAPDWTSAVSSSPGATALMVHGLPKPKTSYFFVARAVDEAGNADDNGREVSARTGADTSPPAFGGCSAVTDVSFETIRVTWDAASDNGTASDDVLYEIWVRPVGTPGERRDTAPMTTVTGKTEVTIGGLKSGQQYEVLCGAKDAAGNRDDNHKLLTATTVIDAEPPKFTGVATAVGGVPAKTVELTWSAAADNAIENEGIVYAVYVSTTPGQEVFTDPPALLTEPGATSATVTALPTRSTYYFVVRARDRAGNEDTNQTEASAVLATSFSLDVQPVFDRTCAILICHTKGVDLTNPPIQGMDLDVGAAYANIVDVVAREGANLSPAEPNIKRVDSTSSDPNDSYLWRKVRVPLATGIFGALMPPPQAQRPLTLDELEIIREWIVQGAHDN